MELAIELDQRRLVALGERPARALDELAQRRPLRGIGVLGGEPCREPFELEAQLEDLDDVGDVELGHERAPARQDDHEVLPREAPQGAAHGREPDAELGCQGGLVDGRSGRQRE